MNYFEAIPKPENVAKLEDLAPVIELYHHMVKAGNLDEAENLLYKRLVPNPLYFQFGAYQLCIELLRALFLDGENAPPRLKDESAQGWTLAALASTYSLSGQPHRSITVFQNAFLLAEKMDNKKNLAIGLGNMAQAQLKIGALSTAESNLRRRIDLCREIADEQSEAIGHADLGYILSYRGTWQEAGQELNKGLEIFEKQQYFTGVGIYWTYKCLMQIFITRANNKEFNIAQMFGQIQKAFAAQTEWTKRNSPVEYEKVRNFWLLGAIYRMDKELTLAEENLFKALNLCRQINVVEIEADILLELARLRYHQKNYEAAKSLGDEALLITERCGYVLQGADVNLLLAQYALEQEQDKAKAKQYAEEAKKLDTCDGPPYYYKVAYEEAERFLENLCPPSRPSPNCDLQLGKMSEGQRGAFMLDSAHGNPHLLHRLSLPRIQTKRRTSSCPRE